MTILSNDDEQALLDEANDRTPDPWTPDDLEDETILGWYLEQGYEFPYIAEP